MQVVILAAGEGTRMRPLTATRPKPMLPVADRPLAAHTADAAARGGASELIFVVGYRGAAVRDYFGASYAGVPVRYAEQTDQLGTAHAVGAARDLLEGPFAVLNGDDLYDAAAIADLLDGGPAVGTFEVADPRPYGVFDVQDGAVAAVIEKPADPPSNLVNVGAYVFPQAARDWLDVPRSDRGEYEITDVLTRTLDEFTVRAVRFDRWLGVGRPWELLEANEWKLAELDGEEAGDVSPDAELRGAVTVEAGATVGPGTVIEGPTLVRQSASVGPNAYVRGPTLVGEGVHIGHAVEVKNSVLMADTAVPHLSYVGDSVLGRRVNFGAGTAVANLRHDDEPIKMTVKGERVSTNRRKFGVVVGDDVKTGINTSLNPGVVLSPGARTDPGAVVRRDR